MKKTIHTIMMDKETYEQNKADFRDGLVFVKPNKETVTLSIWMSLLESIKAYSEVIIFNIKNPTHKMRMRRGVISKWI